MSIETAVIGASGYAGGELLRLLSSHPEFFVRVVTGASQAGKKVGEVHPHLRRYREETLRSFDSAVSDIAAADLVFCGLPHGVAMQILPSLDNKLIVDLGGDFRLDDPLVYAHWNGRNHSAPSAMTEWVYGLPELFRADIFAARRIASPGCYATATLLAAAPVIAAGLTEGVLVVDAVSGTSGAGRTLKENLHFSFVHEDARAYKVGQHQHTPEIEAAFARYAGKDILVSFTPCLIPMTRGIHATCSAQLAPGVGRSDLLDALHAAYASEPFVHVLEDPPGTKDTRGANTALIGAFVDAHAGRAVLTCVIDNLVKGAGGQAIQNANLALGLEETAGLPCEGVAP